MTGTIQNDSTFVQRAMGKSEFILDGGRSYKVESAAPVGTGKVLLKLKYHEAYELSMVEFEKKKKAYIDKKVCFVFDVTILSQYTRRSRRLLATHFSCVCK